MIKIYSKQFIIFILISYCCSYNVLCRKNAGNGNSNYHLIYIDISRCEDRQNLTYSLTRLLDSILLTMDDFLLFLSNGHQPYVINSDTYLKEQKDYLVSILQTMNTSPPFIRFDMDSILNLWKTHDVKNITSDNQTVLLYNYILMHYFVSSDFLKLDEIEIIDKLLLINDLTKKHIDPQRIIINLHYHINDAESFLKRKSELEEINYAGYHYIFSSY